MSDTALSRGGAGRKDHRPDGGRQRDVLLRARRGRRRRGLRLLAGPRASRSSSSDWDELEYDDVGGLFKKTAIVLTKRIGGTSGPIWGTAFLRAGTTLSGTPRAQRGRRRSPRCAPRSRGSSSAATPTSATRRCSTRSSPRSTSSSRRSREGAPDALPRAAATAPRGGGGHQGDARQARAGRYTGERSRDSVDAGAIGVAVLFEAVSKAWQESELERA